jgi:hypothetical protein
VALHNRKVSFGTGIGRCDECAMPPVKCTIYNDDCADVLLEPIRVLNITLPTC